MALPPTATRASRLAVFSWALYDFANTIFSLNIISLYFALWVTVDHGAEDILYSIAFSGSMLFNALTAPVLGATSDRWGRRLPFLFFFTLICVVFTALIGRAGGLSGGLVVFAVANYAFQAGLIYYDALLATVSDEKTRGRVSGLGVAMGYVGAILGILMVKPFVDQGGRGSAFLPTAVLFLLFALPCFLFVREGKGNTSPWRWQHLREGYSQLLTTWQNARQYSNLLRFIAARLLYVDAVNTVIAFMSVYATKVIGFSDSQVQRLLITSTTCAVVGSFGYGFLVERLGPKKTLSVVLVQWVVVFSVAAASFHQGVFYAIGALAGLSLGATWTCDRVFLTRLAPPEYLGQFFGLYALTGRLAAVVGPMIWGGTIWALADWGLARYRVGILALLLLLLAGLIVLQAVQEKK